MSDDRALHAALEKEDPLAVASVATVEELERLRAAEELFEKRYARRRRTSRFFSFAQALVGWVALAGFFANAYQNWNNKKQAEERARADEERWAKEFKRAQDADKYRAFFETAALATDAKNADKRLVGYALLKEFVDDRDYNSKATLMLEESLAQELRENTAPVGLDEERQAAVPAILTALAQTSDCRSLARAARSVDKLAKRHVEVEDAEETGEVFRVYVRRLVGRAAEVCPSPKEFRAVRQPLRDTLVKLPELGGLAPKGKLTPADANRRIAELLLARCNEESEASGATDCPEVLKGYRDLCQASRDKERAEYQNEAAACQVFASH